MASETFYRWHRADAPAFSADNAWSGLWGSEFSTDGSRTKCRSCDGTGEGWQECPRCHGDFDHTETCERCSGEGVITECEDCNGEGWQDCVRGYSCCWTSEDLATYLAYRTGDLDDDWGRVIVFEGERTGTGFDGEPTAVPTKILKEMPWSMFKETLT